MLAKHAPLEEGIMKLHHLISLACLALCVGVVACSSSAPDPEPTSSVESRSAYYGDDDDDDDYGSEPPQTRPCGDLDCYTYETCCYHHGVGAYCAQHGCY